MKIVYDKRALEVEGEIKDESAVTHASRTIHTDSDQYDQTACGKHVDWTWGWHWYDAGYGARVNCINCIARGHG